MNPRLRLPPAFTAPLLVCLWLTATSLSAQDRPPQGPTQGGFDPAQMRQRMLERLRTQFDVADESEWKVIADRITKVMEARRNAGAGPGGFPMGGPGGPPPGMNPNATGGRPPGADRPAEAGTSPGGASAPRFGGFGGPGGPGGPGLMREAGPEVEALRKAIEAKAPNAEIKAKLAEVRAARKAKEAELEKAQEELRQVLTVRQEAIAVLNGFLK